MNNIRFYYINVDKERFKTFFIKLKAYNLKNDISAFSLDNNNILLMYDDINNLNFSSELNDIKKSLVIYDFKDVYNLCSSFKGSLLLNTLNKESNVFKSFFKNAKIQNYAETTSINLHKLAKEHLLISYRLKNKELYDRGLFFMQQSALLGLKTSKNYLVFNDIYGLDYNPSSFNEKIDFNFTDKENIDIVSENLFYKSIELYGNLNSSDLLLANFLLNSSSKLGYIKSNYVLGFVYMNALGVEQDLSKALDFFKKSDSNSISDNYIYQIKSLINKFGPNYKYISSINNENKIKIVGIEDNHQYIYKK